MPEALSFLGFLLAAVMTVIAFLCWRKAMNYHVLLMESSGRIESLKRKGRQLEGELTKLGEKLEQSRANCARLEKEATSGKHQLTTDNARLAEDNAALKDRNHQLDLKNEHLRTQVEALTQQLREADNIAKETQTKLSYASKETQEQINSTRQRLEDEMREWQSKYRLLEAEHRTTRNQFSTLKRKVEETDINRVQDIKRKAAHYESLYKSMRGLREMADERNRNWETALRKFSAWILRTTDARTDVTTAPLGPMVGEALEIIGDRLIYDEYAGKSNAPTASSEPTVAT